MTSVDEVVERAARESRRPHRGLWIALFVILAALVATGAGVLTLYRSVEVLSLEADDNARAAQVLADQVTRLGGVPVVQPPAPEQGPPGDRGPAGRGIAGTAIVDGRLLIAYDDGSSRDVGQVVGQPGAGGAPGRGVVGTAIAGGRLVVSYSDSTTEDVGQVVGTDGDDGAPGRSVTSVDAVDGRLVVSYSDGSTQDAGPLPAGPAGRGVQRAEVVDCRWFVTYTDGAREDAGNACTTETFTPAPTTTGVPLLPTVR